MITNFSDFCTALLDCGFSLGGGNDKGIFALVPYGWNEQENIDSPIKWHTEDPETDPWQWRMRVLEERDDIAYSKVFFNASGYITKAWYPYFYAVRRQGKNFDEAYSDGKMSAMSKRVYEIISTHKVLPLHEIKLLGAFSKDENSAVEKALTQLQMRMFITMSGQTQKKNKQGEGYGWFATVFSTVEDFWASRNLILEDIDIDTNEAYDKIKEQVLQLNPSATTKKIDKFIKG